MNEFTEVTRRVSAEVECCECSRLIEVGSVCVCANNKREFLYTCMPCEVLKQTLKRDKVWGRTIRPEREKLWETVKEVIEDLDVTQIQQPLNETEAELLLMCNRMMHRLP